MRFHAPVFFYNNPIGRLDVTLVYIAPAPVFTESERLHDWMAGGVKMLGGMLVFRGVTATDVPTDLADAQMHPSIPAS